MSAESKDLLCLACGQAINKDSKTSIEIEQTLRWFTLGRMFPAFLHDLLRQISLLESESVWLKKSQGFQADPRAARALEEIVRAIEELSSYSLLARIHIPYEENLWLRDLAELVRSVLELYRLRKVSNLVLLGKSVKKVPRTYITIFSFLLQEILIKSGRAMRPDVEVHFNIDNGYLSTDILLKHEASFTLASNEMGLLTSQVQQIGGEISIDRFDSKVIIRWLTPLLD